MDSRLEPAAARFLPPIAVTVADAVRMSGLSRSTIYRLMAGGVLDSRMVAGRRLVMFASLNGLFAATSHNRSIAA